MNMNRKRWLFAAFILCVFIFFSAGVQAAETKKLTPIMGNSQCSKEQMYAYFLSYYQKAGEMPVSKTYAKEFILTTVSEAEAEGVRSDVAFALMMHETGYLSFGGDVIATQNNFGGLGTTGGGVKGAFFENKSVGIRAVVQHLKCYASTKKLNNKCVDPRWSDSLRGKAKYVEWLGYKDNPYQKGWANPGDGYGNRLLDIVQKVSRTDASGVSLSNAPEKKQETTTNPTANTPSPSSSSKGLTAIKILLTCLVLLVGYKLIISYGFYQRTQRSSGARSANRPKRRTKTY